MFVVTHANVNLCATYEVCPMQFLSTSINPEKCQKTTISVREGSQQYSRWIKYWSLYAGSGLEISQCSGTESMSDWRGILRTEDIKLMAFNRILPTVPEWVGSPRRGEGAVAGCKRQGEPVCLRGYAASFTPPEVWRSVRGADPPALGPSWFRAIILWQTKSGISAPDGIFSAPDGICNGRFVGYRWWVGRL